MANDEEVKDLGGLESANPLAEDTRTGAEDQPAPPSGVGEDDPLAAAVLHEDTTGAAVPAFEDPAASASPTQVAE